MTYETACRIAGVSNPKAIAKNAKFAASQMNHLTIGSPLRFSVALKILMNAAR